MTHADADAMDTSSARYLRAKAIALDLLDAPRRAPDDIAHACDGDTDLERDVQWLIDAAGDASGDDAVAPPLRDAFAGSDMHLEAPVPRDYRVLRRIGEGGMGVVYLAERIDAGLRQTVALKLLHPLPEADPAAQRRFATERAILSTLSHPNIAHLVDGGVTATGRPFLAMEHVDGERIDSYCDRAGLGLARRLALFLKVCAAVEHAHRHLVIHRDIKPSNILVGADGEPKLLDFGIARLLDTGHADATRTDARTLTLAYASPEQIAGGPLGTASDIYSLGVVLYQLVAGTRPFEPLESSHLLPQAIVAGDVPPPSRRVRELAREPHVRARVKRVPADLDAIVLKAMRREPDQRYPSAAAFAADVRRFLADRPVRAQRGHWRYRLRRFVSRRRGALAVAGLFLAVLGVSVSEWTRQHARIATERDRAGAVVDYMNALYQNTDSLHLGGQDVTVRQMLDLGAASLRARTDLSPEHRAALLLATGRAYNALGLTRDAVPLVEQARDVLQAPGVETSLEQRAELQLALATSYSGSRRLADAIAADGAALALLRDAPGDHANDIAQATIRWLHNHAVTLDIPLEQVRARLRDVLAQLDARPDAPPGIRIAAWRAMVMAYGSDGDGALAAAEEAMRIASATYPADDPRLLPVRYAWVTAVHERNPTRAAELLPGLIADHERRMGPSVRVAALLSNYGSTLTRLDRARESLPVYERAAAMAREVSGENSQLYRLTIGNYAAAHMALGDSERAVALVHTVLPGLVAEAQTEGATEAQVFLAASRETLAHAAMLRGDPAMAEDELAQAADGLSRIDPDAYPDMYLRVLTRLAQVQHERHRDGELAQTLARFDAAMAGRTDAAFAGYVADVAALRPP